MSLPLRFAVLFVCSDSPEPGSRIKHIQSVARRRRALYVDYICSDVRRQACVRLTKCEDSSIPSTESSSPCCCCLAYRHRCQILQTSLYIYITKFMLPTHVFFYVQKYTPKVGYTTYTQRPATSIDNMNKFRVLKSTRMPAALMTGRVSYLCM